jgi:hypothetical protein
MTGSQRHWKEQKREVDRMLRIAIWMMEWIWQVHSEVDRGYHYYTTQLLCVHLFHERTYCLTESCGVSFV